MALASGLLGRQRADADFDDPTKYWLEAGLTKTEGKVKNMNKLESLPCHLSLSASSREAERKLYERGLAFCLGLPYHQPAKDDANPNDKPPKGGRQKKHKQLVSRRTQPEPSHPYNPTGAASVAGLGFVKGLVKGKALGDSSYGAAPDSTYGPPDSSYGIVESSYGAPDSSYGAPEPTYGAPHQTYATPDSTYSSSPAPSYTTTPEVSYSEPEQDEYGSPSAPAIVQLIKSEKLEEHPEVEVEHLHENTVAEDKVSKITLSIEHLAMSMTKIDINWIIIDFGFFCNDNALSGGGKAGEGSC